MSGRLFFLRVDHCSLCLLVVMRAWSIANCQCSADTVTDYSQCAVLKGEYTSSAVGFVTCLDDGSLTVSIRLPLNWTSNNLITVSYTCWSQDQENEAESGLLLTKKAINIEYALTDWLNETVNIMAHHGAMCRVHSCYEEQNECDLYGITMTNTKCSFGSIKSALVTPVTPTHSLDGLSHQQSSILPSTSATILIDTSSPNQQSTEALLTINPSSSYELKASLSSILLESSIITPLEISITTPTPHTMNVENISDDTGVPVQLDNQSGLKVILPVILVSVVGVVSLTVILLCFIGFKRHRLNSMKLYTNDEVFNPYFDPVDVGTKIKISTAQSIYSVYDSLRSNDNMNNDDGTEDEKSEILDSSVVGDDKSSNISIVIGEDDKNHQQQIEDSMFDCGVIQPQQEISGITNVNIQHPSSSDASEHGVLNTVSCQHTKRSFSHSSNSSGYATESEASSSTYQPLTSIDMQDKQYRNCLQSDVEQLSHVTRQVMVHQLACSSTEGSEKNCDLYTEGVCRPGDDDRLCHNIVDNRCRFDREEDSHEQATATKCCIMTDNGMEIVHLFIPTNSHSHEDQCISTVSYDLISECSFSLNPSHFEPLDDV